MSVNSFPEAGFVRLESILGPDGPIPVGRSTWWRRVKQGRFPKPVKLGPRTTAWRVEDIRKLIARFAGTERPRSTRRIRTREVSEREGDDE